VGAASLVIFKGAGFEFVRPEYETPHFPLKKSSHLHPNRPCDQLSCRTPRYTLVAEQSATTHLRAHFEARPQIELATQGKKETLRDTNIPAPAVC